MAHSIRLFIDPVRGSLPESDPIVQGWVNVCENETGEPESTIDTRSTVTGQSEVGSNSSSQRKHSEREEERRTRLRIVARKYEISWDMAVRLVALRDYELVIVCDDSGSMLTPIEDTDRTRWETLCFIVKIILEIGVIFDSNGVDIYFLNADPILNVKDPAQVTEIFSRQPSGYTLLASTLEKIFQSSLSQRGNDKKLLVFVATDGASTDDNGKENFSAFEHVMMHRRKVDTTFVTFLPCTDDSQYLDCLRGWDRTMRHVDVTETFHRERDQVRRYRGPDFSFALGDYVVKAMVGAIDAEIDRLNEPS